MNETDGQSSFTRVNRFARQNPQTGKHIRSPAEMLLGNDRALQSAARKRIPDKRQLSMPWLAGVFLTGISSLALMGGALHAALDGRQALSTAHNPSIISSPSTLANSLETGKGDRLKPLINFSRPSDKRVLSVATMVKQGDLDVIKTREFTHVRTPLAIGSSSQFSYEPFNPLAVFSDETSSEVASVQNERIYGAEVDSELIVQIEDFPSTLNSKHYPYRMSTAQAEQIVRQNAGLLDNETVQMQSLAFVNPARFELAPQNFGIQPLNVTIIDDNISNLERSVRPSERFYDQQIISLSEALPVQSALLTAGFTDNEAAILSPEIEKNLKKSVINTDQHMILSLEKNQDGSLTRIMRISFYQGSSHLLSFARRDDNVFVPSQTPHKRIASTNDSHSLQAATPLQIMPTIYDAIYRSTLSRDLPNEVAKKLVSIFASDVDFQTRVRPTDHLELFYTRSDNENQEEFQVLHAKIKLGEIERKYYRFTTPDDQRVDYYDENGKSAKKFLIRNPVPTGRFRSGFGMRRHPVLRYSKMHTGVDWSAKRGTPIIASGNGVVKKASWAGGYGKQTLIQHANGYVSSYSHQTAYAKGIKAGARVRQGQVIGYVGTTGLSTGPHLHYELIVNGRKVDPMRIRLPQGRVLKGEILDNFKAELARIDALVNEDTDNTTTLASR